MAQNRTSRVGVRLRAARSKRLQPGYLFVYGTLARGQELHGYLKRSPGTRFLGAARIKGELYAISGESYPGAVRNAGKNGFVSGELYKLANPKATLTRLDEIEGCADGLFKRSIVDVYSASGKRKAWAYFYAQPLRDAERIPSGVFRG